MTGYVCANDSQLGCQGPRHRSRTCDPGVPRWPARPGRSWSATGVGPRRSSGSNAEPYVQDRQVREERGVV